MYVSSALEGQRNWSSDVVHMRLASAATGVLGKAFTTMSSSSVALIAMERPSGRMHELSMKPTKVAAEAEATNRAGRTFVRCMTGTISSNG